MTIEAIFGKLGERGLFKSIDERCKRLFVTVEDIVGKSRTKAVVRARHEVWRWMHDECGLSWPEIATIFGRSHDSIMQASDKRDSRAKKVLEDRVAEKIAAWLERVDLADGDARSYVDPLDRERIASLIRDGDWRDKIG